MTQPVIIQSFEDEFELLNDVSKAKTPAKAGSILIKAEENGVVGKEEHTKYRAGVGKLMHIMQYSRLEIYNATRDCTRHLQGPSKVHIKAMSHIMSYCVRTKERGFIMKPNTTWDGNPNFEITIGGRSDSDYAANPDDQISITGCRVMVNGVPVSWRSSTQKHVTLSVTEADNKQVA